MAAVSPAQPLPMMITFSTYQSSMPRKSAKVPGGWIGRSAGDVILAPRARYFLTASSPQDESVRPADKGLLDPPLNAIAAPRNLRDAGAGRSRMVSQTVGRRARRGDCRSWLARAEPRLSRERRARASAEPDRRETSQLARARKTDALQIFRG